MKYLIILAMLCSITSIAQPRKCGQVAHTSRLKFLEGYEVLKVEVNQRRTIPCDSLVVPVAVHIQGSSATKLCLQNYIHQQIKILNDDFRGDNKDLAKYLAVADKYPNTQVGRSCIRFVLADQNHPSGYGLSDGMAAITVNQTDGDWEYKWRNYLNLFIFQIEDNVLGYAPLGGRGKGDGAVIAKFAWGGEGWCGDIGQNDNFKLGRTATHELGHYFGLPHIWGNRMGCNHDDGISDTPNSEGPNYGCAIDRITTCETRDLAMNFMDYSDDACMYMFTAEQVKYMETYLQVHLPHLIENAFKVISHLAPEEPEPVTVEPLPDTTETITEIPEPINEADDGSLTLWDKIVLAIITFFSWLTVKRNHKKSQQK